MSTCALISTPQYVLTTVFEFECPLTYLFQRKIFILGVLLKRVLLCVVYVSALRISRKAVF